MRQFLNRRFAAAVATAAMLATFSAPAFAFGADKSSMAKVNVRVKNLTLESVSVSVANRNAVTFRSLNPDQVSQWKVNQGRFEVATDLSSSKLASFDTGDRKTIYISITDRGIEETTIPHQPKNSNAKTDLDKKINTTSDVPKKRTNDEPPLVTSSKTAATDIQGAPMVRVPGGNYGGTARSSPRIELKPFGICRYEVTWGHFQAVRDVAVQKGYTDLANAGSGRGPMHPVVKVTWYDAVKWCNALSEIDGREPAYTVNGKVYRVGESDKVSVCHGKGYRLPTEDEWCAAFGGGLPKENTIFSGSNVDTEVAWFKDNSGGGTQPVGQKKPNKLGIHDMSGNVAEWTEEQDVTYFYVVPIANIQRHARGGSWSSSGGEWAGYPWTRKGELTASASDPETANMPTARSEQIGFRYVITEK